MNTNPAFTIKKNRIDKGLAALKNIQEQQLPLSPTLPWKKNKSPTNESRKSVSFRIDPLGSESKNNNDFLLNRDSALGSQPSSDVNQI